jgi:hypothetical protein
VGRDNITNVTIGATETGNSGGRIRAVTVSIEAVPFGKNLWVVKVNNGTSGPITDLEVDAYTVDDSATRSSVRCLPAKGNISLRELTRDALAEGLSGGLDAIGQQAQSMYSGLPLGMGFGASQLSQFGQFGSYGGMMVDYAMNSPQASQMLRQAQRQLIDRFPRVIPAGQTAEVLYLVEGNADLWADIQFADEAGDLWRRLFGKTPEPILEGD